MPGQPLGILGGTFDPIHRGHLAVAEYVFTHCPLAQIHFTPCLYPPHRRSPPQASPAQRLEMIHLAIADHPGWVANDIDFQRPAPSYMVDTLSQLHQQQPHTPWCLILGMDAFGHFNQWREWEKILTLAHLIIVNRPEFELPTEDWSRQLLAATRINHSHELTQSLAGRILILEMPPCPLSATEIRRQSAQLNEKDLPRLVLNYIRKYHLYSH